MTSAHTISEQPAFSPWLERCKRRFPFAKAIEGSGEFCVACCPDKIVRLFERIDEMEEYLKSHPTARQYRWEPKDISPPKPQEPVRKMNLWKIPGDGQDE